MNNSLTISAEKQPVPVGAELVRKATKAELQASLSLLFRAFASQQRDDPAQLAAVYVMVLGEFSAWSIKEGIRQLISGEVDGIDMTWLPSTAVVAHTIRTIAAKSPEAKERQWRHRLEAWRTGQEWNPHWAQDPESPSFPHLCPPHLVLFFEEATRQRKQARAA